MRILIVEDDFAARKLLQTYLAPYGEADIVVDGDEAMEAFNLSMAEKKPYDLICLDIMLPKKSGQEVLKEIREIEREKGMMGSNGVKILMTTALNDAQNIIEAFKSQCEAYLPKPIQRENLLEELRTLNLIE